MMDDLPSTRTSVLVPPPRPVALWRRSLRWLWALLLRALGRPALGTPVAGVDYQPWDDDPEAGWNWLREGECSPAFLRRMQMDTSLEVRAVDVVEGGTQVPWIGWRERDPREVRDDG